MPDFYEQDVQGAEDTQTGRFLTFLIENDLYGIEIRCVTSIIGIQEITKVPEMPSYIKGIINLRGKIIPLMDVRLRLGKEERDYDDRTCVIVIDVLGTTIGLIIDSVSEVLTIPEADVEELPTMNANKENRFIKYIGKLKSGVCLLIDFQKLVAEDELSSLEFNV